MRIEIVPEQACPGCGAYDGNPEPALDFPNRPKVDNHWKCYNPACEVGYYTDGEITEMKLTPEEEREMNARVKAQVEKMMEGKTFVNVSPPGSAIQTWELR